MEVLNMSQEMLYLWNAVLTLAGVLVGLWAREKSAELARLNILLNKTREEVARDNVTQAEIDKIMAHIDQRFNKLEVKIDQLIQGKINA
jgi:molybdenum cofactor biosynthesis enzyme MoaA|tara:strand:+ start:55 stop:321 length:267 start_codon:yes stop_codon:yes gene_type:complete